MTESFVKSYLMETLKSYPTVIQNTLIGIIADKLDTLYEYTIKFPEIISPNKERMDILRAIADQFLFTIKEEGDIEEQLGILENILYVYSKRGSVDTIENMWKYYGGNLPKDVKVVIPSNNLFRYSTASKFSGTHVFAKGITHYLILDTPAPLGINAGVSIVEVDDSTHRSIVNSISEGSRVVYVDDPSIFSSNKKVNIGGIYEATIVGIYEDRNNMNRLGIYEIRLTNNTYPIEKLREFMLDELVAAGNYIYFSNDIHLDILDSIDSANSYKYSIYEDYLSVINLEVLKSPQKGITWSGVNHYPLNRKKIDRGDLYLIPSNSIDYDGDSTRWSSKGDILLELTKLIDIYPLIIEEGKENSIPINTYLPYGGFFIEEMKVADIIRLNKMRVYAINEEIQSNDTVKMYCTPTESSVSLTRYLYEKVDGKYELIESEYPGYFVLGNTSLGKWVI